MNRRQLLGCTLGAIATSVTYADCRDENGMQQPDENDSSCLDLSINHFRSVGSDDRVIMTGTALFGFGAYESLLESQKKRREYVFTIYGLHYKIKVTQLSVDSNRAIGCIVCQVNGRLTQL